MRNILIKVMSIITAIVIATSPLNGTVDAMAGSQVSGIIKTNASPGTGQGLYSILGSTIIIKDAIGDVLAQTTSEDYGYFILNNIPNGYSYTLEVHPPLNNPGDLLTYTMDLDVYGDTFLYDANNTGLLTIHNEDTLPANNNVVFSGRMLLDGDPGIGTGQWNQLFIVNYTKGYDKPINASTSNSPTSAGTFAITVPKDNNYVLYQEETGDFLSINRGIRNMSPTMTLLRDSYRVFNIDTTYNATNHSLRVVDQCGVPFSGVGIRGYQSSTVSVRGNNTATVKHVVGAGYTDINGVTSLDTQSTGDSVNLGQGVALRLSALNPNTNEIVLLEDKLIPYPLAQNITISVNVPFHTCSDLIPPSITNSRTPVANSNGWNNSDVIVTFTCSDNESGIASCTNPVTLSTDGLNQSVNGTATDNTGNTRTDTVSGINIDKTKPTATNPTISGWLVVNWGNPVIAANASDALSGVTGGEYYIDNDPGQGNGTSMTYANGKISAQPIITTGTANGWHTIYMRSKDAAGNWSSPTSVRFFFF